MVKNKRFISLVLTTGLLLQAAACQSGNLPSDDTSTETAALTAVSEITESSAEVSEDSLTVRLSDVSTTSSSATDETTRTRTSAYAGTETSTETDTSDAIAPEFTLPVSSQTEESSEDPNGETQSGGAETGNETIDGLLEASAGAFVYDLVSGEALLWHEPQNRVETASIGKLATVLFAKTLIEPDEIIRVGEEVKLISPTSSLAFVSNGMELTLTMLIEGMMLPSGNDAAYAVAAAGGRRLRDVDDLTVPVEGGTDQAAEDVQRFMDALNIWALDQGMEDSSWAEPDGYRHEDQYTTLADMVTLGALAAEDDDLLRITAAASDRVIYASGESMTWENSNQLLNRDSPWFRSNVVGLKTGSFFDYFNVLVLERESEGQQRLIGVFGLPYTKDRFDLATLLLDEITE